MMQLSLRQTMMTLILIATLLTALAVGILKIEAIHNPPTKPHVTHTLAWYCPPPPLPC